MNFNKDLDIKIDEAKPYCVNCGTYIGDIIDKCWAHFVGISSGGVHKTAYRCPICEKEFDKNIEPPKWEEKDE
jgi:hypothetical protein